MGFRVWRSILYENPFYVPSIHDIIRFMDPYNVRH